MAKNNNNKPKIFLGQNMSARVRSPLFWTGVVGIIGSAVVSFGGLIGLDLSDKVDEVTANSSQIIEFVFLILGLIGVTNDPTSKKYRDTGMAQTYKKPRDDENVNEYVQWQTESDDFQKNNPTPIAPKEINEVDGEETVAEEDKDLPLEEQAESVEEDNVEEDTVVEQDKEDNPKG